MSWSEILLAKINNSAEVLEQIYSSYPGTTLDRSVKAASSAIYHNCGTVTLGFSEGPIERQFLTNCKNCGASLNSFKCEYCGSNYNII